MVLDEKIRELHLWFQDRERLQLRKAWTFSGDSYPSLNEILSTMKESGWTMEITDDEYIFSRSIDSSSLKEDLATKNLIMDDQENMTLLQLDSCWFGHSNDIATGDLSTDDYDTKESDELDEVSDNTNDNIGVNSKAEKHPSSVESNSNSESMEKES